MTEERHGGRRLAELADVYLRHYESDRDEDFWSFEEVNEVASGNPEEAWELTLALIEKAPSKRALAYVAAGPLEDLMYYHGELLMGRIEREARNSERFRHALTGVRLEKSNPVFARWEALMREYGYLEPGVKPPLEE